MTGGLESGLEIGTEFGEPGFAAFGGGSQVVEQVGVGQGDRPRGRCGIAHAGNIVGTERLRRQCVEGAVDRGRGARKRGQDEGHGSGVASGGADLVAECADIGGRRGKGERSG